MSLHYAYSSQIWPSSLTAVLLVALAVYAWHRRTVPGARAFAITCLIAVPWVAGNAAEVAAVDEAGKLFWFKFQAAWQMPAATALTCFALEYAWPGRWLTRRNLLQLSIAPLLTLVLVVTNNVHHLTWVGFTFQNGQVIPLRGPLNWLLVVYALGWPPWLSSSSPGYLFVPRSIAGRRPSCSPAR